ncbi:hypothetical protein FQR65_LT20952 [Abscondita terminalis]|nr:hypothetical protein FQR65_LT20952 [Abscondita terminalis]
MRRIVLDAAGRRYDIALPKGDGLAGALAAVGVHLGAGERVLGPDGADVDSATIASNLREGGLYSVARPPSESKQRHLARGSAAYRVKTLPWAVIGFGSVAAMLAVKFGLVSISTSVTAIIAVLAAVIAVLASLRMVLAHAAHARAAATPMVVISAWCLMAVVVRVSGSALRDELHRKRCGFPRGIPAALGLLASLYHPVPLVTTVAAAALLFAAIVAAVMVLPLMRGERSLGWSRAGDILDAVAVALVIPTGLIAAQTLNVLQGVLAG